MFALSTAWNYYKHNDGGDIIEEIASLGFSEVELNFLLTKEVVDGIFLKTQELDIKVVSLHNYCPIPEGLKSNEASPDYYSLSSLDEGIRKRGVAQTIHTIETADRFGTNSVIIHAGKVEMSYNSKFLVQLYEQGLKDSIQFKIYRRDMIQERRLKSKRHFDRLLLSLEELLKVCSRYDIILGIENRFYIQEIPDTEELRGIFNRFSGPNIGYWHDIGHAVVQERIGFLDAKEPLLAFRNNLIGLHIHDVLGIKDHRAPMMGEVDFSVLKEFDHRALIKVLEIHRPATAEEVKKGKEYLETQMNRFFNRKTISSQMSTDYP